MKKLYVSDLDGTLLNHDSVVSERSARLLGELNDDGVLFTVATARTPATVDPLMRSSRLRLPAIVMTGASMWDMSRRRYISPSLLERGDADTAVDTCLGHGLHPFVYIMRDDGLLDVLHTGPMSAQERRFVDQRRNLPLKKFYLDATDHDLVGVDNRILMFAMGPVDVVGRVADMLRGSTRCSLSVYPDIFHPELGNLEILAPGVSKAAAVRRLADMVGADTVTVFGDNLNDLPMFEMADRAIAVANAEPSVRAAATDVIGPNTADSVARFIALDR